MSGLKGNRIPIRNGTPMLEIEPESYIRHLLEDYKVKHKYWGLVKVISIELGLRIH